MAELDSTNPLPWWQSRAQVGTLVTLAATVLTGLGLQLDVGQVTDLILLAIQLAGGLLAFWGNIKRTRTLDNKQVLPGLRLQ